jgi:putative chitinase
MSKVDVESWQRALLSHGYEIGAIDGDFGPATLRASLRILTGESGGNGRHVMTNPAAFFLKVREAFGALNQGQVDGINALLAAMERWPITWAAYGLATAWHETAETMRPIKEYGSSAYFKKRYDIEGDNPALARKLGNLNPGDGVTYAGRGYVQLTGRLNYQKYGIADDPDKALEPATAARIMIDGMQTGAFTGKKLSDYLPGDYVNARRVVNGLDRAQQIADHAWDFETALSAGGW